MQMLAQYSNSATFRASACGPPMRRP